jgi:hypothetical protein
LSDCNAVNREPNQGRPPVRFILISATYGAGGDWIAQQVASRLCLPLVVPQAISARAGERLVRSAPTRSAFQVAPPVRLHQLLAVLARVGDVFGSWPFDEPPGVDSLASSGVPDNAMDALAATGGAVSLTPAAAAFLNGANNVLRVRLDGPPKRRVAQAMVWEGRDRLTCEGRLARIDRADNAHAARYCGVDPTDIGQYQIVLDSTALPLAACVDIIVNATIELL